MVDFHSHILPGIDDGSTDVEMSLEMLKREAAQGIRAVVATPHFYANENTPRQFLARRQEAAERLREAAKAVPGLPKVLLGAEVTYFRGMSDAEALWDLRIADTNYILVELPMPPWHDRVYEELGNLVTKQNLLPIVAHVDRYLPPLLGHRMIDRLLEKPVLLQANTSFFLGKRAKLALRLLREQCIHLLGSDCHDLTDRVPNLGDLTQKLGKAELEHIQYHQQLVLSEEIL